MWSNDEEAPLRAEIKVVGGRFFAIGEGPVSYKNKVTIEGFGLGSYDFLALTDEGRDKDAAIGRRMKPPVSIMIELGLRVNPVNDNLLFERIVKEMEITISLT